MIYPRLKVAKDLLSEDGAIFISIGDEELFNLQKIANEIFGASNFVANLIWQSTPGSNTGDDVKTVTENILLYCKNKSICKFSTQEITDKEKYSNQDEYYGKRGGFVLNKLDRRMTGQHYSEALNYAIEMPDGTAIYPGGAIEKQEHWNWRWSKTKVEWGIKNGFIVMKNTNNGWAVYFKQYEKVNNDDKPIVRTLSYQNFINIDGANSARNVVIVGDTKQLPNVVTDDIKTKAKAIFDSFNVSEGYQYTNSFLQSILDVMPNVTQTLLREHYRCHPKIINFCNQKFYRGELIIMTTDKGEEDVLSVVKTVAGNHERNHYSQRQIDVIKNEIIPKYVSNPEETGIITPYKNQVEALSKEITDIDAATVHKFQGKEKENIIISTVDDEISDFADDPYLINVAVSRAKKKLMLVVTGNEQSRERNITELIDYIQYNNFEVTESKIYSIFDYLYKQYTEERRVYLQKHKKVSEYDSENLMYSLIEDIISANKYSSLDVVCHFPLNMLIKNPELLNEQECQYAMNPATHLDFLIYNRIGKKPVLAIEVDGYEYHKEDTVQASRDLLKNHIMELYEVPLLRFMTNGSGEKEKIIEMLDKLVG